MKSLKTLLAVAMIGLTASLARAEGDGKHARGPGAMMENLVPPFLVDELKLTADQKAKFDELNSAFKKDAEALREKRQASMEKLRALLTDEQKAKLEEAKARLMERRNERGGERGGEKRGPKPPPAE